MSFLDNPVNLKPMDLFIYLLIKLSIIRNVFLK